MAAAFGSCKSAVEVLLRLGADGRAVTEDGVTARMFAEERGHSAIVALLSKA
jgi:ankyrin repeat protein